MLECQACFRRCLKALISCYPQQPPFTNLSVIRPARTVRRLHTSHRPLQAFEVVRDDVSPEVPPLAPEDAQQDTQQETKRSPPKNTWGRTKGKQRAEEMKNAMQGKNPSRLEVKYLKTELKYLTDPVKLADHVKHVLESDDAEKADALVKLSGRAIANTVCWNHLIDWHMKNGRTRGAFDIYNDMKKRAQKPDNYTYTILLRGLANHAHLPGSLGRALSLYHGMMGPNSKIQPNITHVNAVIKVCARCNDMESLWDIVSKLPERGPLAADSWTFSTIFNHMRYQALTMVKAGDENEADKRDLTLIKARQIWSVMVARWRKGELRLDEEVVCSLGRVLLTGQRPRDWDDVLSLVTQTTGIPRMQPALTSPKSAGPPDAPEPTSDQSSGSMLALGEPSNESEKPGSEFAPTTVGVKTQPTDTNTQVFQIEGRKALYIKPDVLTLQLVMEACDKLYAKKTARLYWDLLTDPNTLKIPPDLAAIHSFLRILKFNRASTEAAELMGDFLPLWHVRPIGLTHKLAMSACVRDKHNPNVMDSAARILESMQNTLREPDLPTLESYLELVLSKKDTTITEAAIDRLQPTLVNLRSYLSFGPAKSARNPGASELTPDRRRHGAELMQRVLACYDQVLAPGHKVEAGKRSLYLERKKSLAAYVTRYRTQWKLNELGRRDWGPRLETGGRGRGRGMGDAIGGMGDEGREGGGGADVGSGIEELGAKFPRGWREMGRVRRPSYNRVSM